MDRRSEIPEFVLHGVTWRCWVTDTGQFEWRSACGRYTAGRTCNLFWSKAGPKSAGDRFPTLKAAFGAASSSLRSPKAA